MLSLEYIYEPSATPVSVGNDHEESLGSVTNEWNSEKIGEFVTKLGFKDGNMNVDNFLYLNQVSTC